MEIIVESENLAEIYVGVKLVFELSFYYTRLTIGAVPLPTGLLCKGSEG